MSKHDTNPPSMSPDFHRVDKTTYTKPSRAATVTGADVARIAAGLGLSAAASVWAQAAETATAAGYIHIDRLADATGADRADVAQIIRNDTTHAFFRMFDVISGLIQINDAKTTAKRLTRLVFDQMSPDVCPDVTAGHLKIDANTGRLAVALNESSGHRLWSIARKLDTTGGGRVHIDEIMSFIVRFGVIGNGGNTLSKSRVIHIIYHDAKWLNIYFRRFDGVNGYVYLNSAKITAIHLTRLAYIAYGNDDLIKDRAGYDKPIYVTASGTLQHYKSQLYAAWHAMRPRQIARAEICRLWRLTDDTLYTYEKLLGDTLDVRPNFAHVPIDQIAAHAADGLTLPAHARRHAYRFYDAETGRKRWHVFMRWQLPNTYISHMRQHTRRGMARKIRVSVNSVLCDYSIDYNGDGNLSTQRLYFTDYKRMKRVTDSDGVTAHNAERVLFGRVTATATKYGRHDANFWTLARTHTTVILRPDFSPDRDTRPDAKTPQNDTVLIDSPPSAIFSDTLSRSVIGRPPPPPEVLPDYPDKPKSVKSDDIRANTHTVRKSSQIGNDATLDATGADLPDFDTTWQAVTDKYQNRLTTVTESPSPDIRCETMQHITATVTVRTVITSEPPPAIITSLTDTRCRVTSAGQIAWTPDGNGDTWKIIDCPDIHTLDDIRRHCPDINRRIYIAAIDRRRLMTSRAGAVGD